MHTYIHLVIPMHTYIHTTDHVTPQYGATNCNFLLKTYLTEMSLAPLFSTNLQQKKLRFSINNVTVSGVLYCIIFKNTANLCLNGNVSIENVFVSNTWFPNNYLYCFF